MCKMHFNYSRAHEYSLLLPSTPIILFKEKMQQNQQIVRGEF